MESGQPSVSVIIPVFNREGTIGYCLDSVLAQSWERLEVIVVNDHSTDATAAVVDRVADSRLQLIENPGQRGAQAARNAGIRAANSDWIAFQDSDDEWAPQKIERQMSALAEHGSDPMTVVHCDCWRYTPETGERQLWNLDPVEGERPLASVLGGPGPMFQGMLTSRTALKHIGLLDENVPSYQEWDTAIRLAAACRFVHLHEPLFTYYLHQGPTISTTGGKDLAGYEHVVTKHREAILSECGEAVLNAHYHLLLRKCLNGRQWDAADRYFQELKQSQGMSLLTLRLLRHLHLAPADVRRWVGRAHPEGTA